MKKDKTCYAAWIMLAACAQELKQFNQAQYALMKAIELDENQPAAHLVYFIHFRERIVHCLCSVGYDTIK